MVTSVQYAACFESVVALSVLTADEEFHSIPITLVRDGASIFPFKVRSIILCFETARFTEYY